MANCDGCGNPGQPYTYRGETFDGLHANRGKRLCSPCNGKAVDAEISALAEECPVTPIAAAYRFSDYTPRKKGRTTR